MKTTQQRLETAKAWFEANRDRIHAGLVIDRTATVLNAEVFRQSVAAEIQGCLGKDGFVVEACLNRLRKLYLAVEGKSAIGNPQPGLTAKISPTEQTSGVLVDVVNAKDPAVKAMVNRGEAVYIGRAYRNADGWWAESPLANPFKVGRDGTRAEICDRFANEILWPCIERRDPEDIRWLEVSRLAGFVNPNRTLHVACWCRGCKFERKGKQVVVPDAQCHGDDVALGIVSVAMENAKDETDKT